MLSKFHSFVKLHLITKYGLKGGRVINLTLGSDEDPSLWAKTTLKEVIGIDGNRARVAVSKSKIRHTHDFCINYIHYNPKELIFNGENDIEIRKHIKSKYEFDFASIFFDLEHFFEKETYFRNLMTNVSDNLKIGGHLVMTGFSGERINEVMTRTKLIRGKKHGNVLWVIESNYSGDFDLSKPNFGKSIKTSYYSSYWFKEKMLVNMDYIIHVSGLYGLELVELTPFECFYNELNHGLVMCKAEQEISFYNDCLVFKKTTNL